MKIFVTVGSSHYNSLVRAIDATDFPQDFDVTIQIAGGTYVPQNHPYIRFTDSIEQYIDDADIVIAHAGAGTVFYLLEQKKKVIVVPNQERIDNHQMDIAEYVDKNNFANVCFELSDIKRCVTEVCAATYDDYINQPFSGYALIETLFKASSPNEVGKLPLNIFSDMDDAVDHIITDTGDVLPGSAIAINPEKVIRSLNEEAIRDAIMSASIRYADGIGVVKTLARKSKQAVARIPGCELWEAIMDKAGRFNLPVYLVGASNETITETAELLQQQYKVALCGVQDGYFDKNLEQDVIEKIAAAKPKIVTVALGSPRQELFIQECQKLCPETFFMGVGGTYDVYTNKVKRAPLIYRKLNLEWFYRLMSQPQRIFRQTNLLKYLYLELTRKL